MVVTTTPQLSCRVTIDGGDVLYKYDADDDSPLVANYDGSASSKVNSIKPITFKVYKEDGTELTEAEYHYFSLYLGFSY